MVNILRPFDIGTDHPDLALLQFAQGACQIGHGDVGNALCRTAGDLEHRLGQAHSAILRRNHRMRTDRIGHAQAGPQIVRVLNAVEHQQESRFLQRIEHIVECDPAHFAGDAGNHALMVPIAARHAFKPLAIDRHDTHAMQLGMLQQITRPAIIAPAVDEDFKNRVRLVAKFGDNGMKTVNEAGLGHGSEE